MAAAFWNRAAKSRHQSQLGIYGLDLTHAPELMAERRWAHFTTSSTRWRSGTACPS